jgi:hypothetical protein
MAMTEQEWLASSDPRPMLDFLQGRPSDRKLRLFAVACCQRVEPFLGSKSRQLVQLAEEFADGLVSEAELRSVNHNYCADEDPALAAGADPDSIPAAHAAYCSSIIAGHRGMNERDAAFNERMSSEQEVQCHLLQCIVGNPFNPVTVNPAWRTSNVIALAQSIYDERAFDRMAILADALEDAGCDNQEILNHCRQPGEHVRGCWVVDVVLGKS